MSVVDLRNEEVTIWVAPESVHFLDIVFDEGELATYDFTFFFDGVSTPFVIDGDTLHITFTLDMVNSIEDYVEWRLEDPDLGIVWRGEVYKRRANNVSNSTVLTVVNNPGVLRIEASGRSGPIGPEGPAGDPASPLPHMVVEGTTEAHINLAFASLPNLGPGVLRTVAVKGEYTLADPVAVPSDVWLDLRLAELRLAPLANCDVITNADWVNGNENIHVRGGFLDANRIAQAHVLGDGPGQSCISFVNVDNFTVRHVRGKSARLHGFDMAVRDIAANVNGDPGCTDGRVAYNEFWDCGDDGITTHWSHGIEIAFNYCHDMAATYSSSSNGIEIDDGSTDIELIGNITPRNVSGVMVQGHAGRTPGRRITINGGISSDNTTAGWTFSQPTAVGPVPAEDITLIGGIGKDNTRTVAITNYSSVQIIGLQSFSPTNADIRVNETVAGTVTDIKVIGGKLTGPTKIEYAGTATSAIVEVTEVEGAKNQGPWVPIRARRTVDAAGRATNVLADDDVMKLVGLRADTEYDVDIRLVYSCNSATPDFQVGFTMPTGAIFEWDEIAGPATATSSSTNVGFPARPRTGSNTAVFGTVAGGTQLVAHFRGRLLTDDAGTLTLRWAQFTADAANPVFLHAASRITAHKIGDL